MPDKKSMNLQYCYICKEMVGNTVELVRHINRHPKAEIEEANRQYNLRMARNG